MARAQRKRDLMRIICPGCDAQYEVPDEVIPEDGRDVQCSNCGATWTVDPPVPAGSARGAEEDARGLPPSEDDESTDDSLVASLPRRELDPKVASILRAEAARESAARAADTRPQPLEVQAELGLTEAPRRTPDHGAAEKAAAKPLPQTREPAQAGNMTVAAAAAGPRRDLLPDIEEIKSSLQSTDARDAADEIGAPQAQDSARRRRGFRLGLLVSVVIFVACLLVYQFAPEIAQAVPRADPWLSSYVTWVDEMRIVLDAKLRQMLDWLDAQAAASGG